jgi:DNA modification methylase
MPSLHWIGKEAVVNHHHTVPFHLLRDVPELSVGEPGAGNLIVQGDNLVALKALLPYYAGQVKCIYIDPPYNTGNEGWVYNDNVNSPLIREWLGKVVGKEAEDLSRHDKLLRQFLRDDGAIYVSIDDNEITSMRVALDEVFGRNNFCAQITIQCNPKGRVLAQEFAKTHEYALVYSRTPEAAVFEVPKTLDDILTDYDEVDANGRRFRALELRNTHRQFNKDTRPNLHFPLYAREETGEVSVQAGDGLIEIWPNWPDGMQGCWTWDRTKCREDRGDLVARRVRGSWKVFRKGYASDEAGEVVTKKPKTIWLEQDIQTEKGQRQIDEILGGRVFYAPKAVGLIRSCIELVTRPGDLILDSFAGSGTTGHAVLQLNAVGTGSTPSPSSTEKSGTQWNASLPGRRFILVEMETKIARDITAERVKRVALGYTNAKGERVEGLGGGFRFCELGEPLFDSHGQIRASVTFADLARHVYFTETGEPLPRERVSKSSLIGECRGLGVYLLFNGILGDRSVNGGNVLTRAALAKLPNFAGPKVIYAAGCLLGRERLQAERITFRQTPYEIKVA